MSNAFPQGAAPRMPNSVASYFHLHLVSDSTGETLTTIAKAASVQYGAVKPIEHMYPMVRSRRQLERALQEIASAPGIVLYTIVSPDLAEELERRCRELSVPCMHVLQPLMKVFESYLGAPPDADRRRPARARCRLFQAHRRLELHHGPRRRPPA